MIYIKAPTIVKNAYYENLGVDYEQHRNYMYMNITGMHVAPALDEDGEIGEGCVLIDNEGQVRAHIRNKTPEQMLNYIGGQCIMEVG